MEWMIDDLLLIVNVCYKVLLLWRAALEAVLEVATAIDNLEDLITREEASLLDVVELINHSLHPIPNDIGHFFLNGDDSISMMARW